VDFVDDHYVFVNEGILHHQKMDRFLDLILGEIPRLKDDELGYGPKGKGFISSVEIPSDVLKAYNRRIKHHKSYKTIRKRK
jgi:hypothetical protein